MVDSWKKNEENWEYSFQDDGKASGNDSLVSRFINWFLDQPLWFRTLMYSLVILLCLNGMYMIEYEMDYRSGEVGVITVNEDARVSSVLVTARNNNSTINFKEELLPGDRIKVNPSRRYTLTVSSTNRTVIQGDYVMEGVKFGRDSTRILRIKKFCVVELEDFWSIGVIEMCSGNKEIPHRRAEGVMKA